MVALEASLVGGQLQSLLLATNKEPVHTFILLKNEVAYIIQLVVVIMQSP